MLQMGVLTEAAASGAPGHTLVSRAEHLLDLHSRPPPRASLLHMMLQDLLGTHTCASWRWEDPFHGWTSMEPGVHFPHPSHRDSEYSERQQLQKAHWSACRGCCLLCTAAMYFLPVALAACMPFPLLCSLELYPQSSVGTWAGASGPAIWHSPSQQLTFAFTIFLSLSSHDQSCSFLGGLRNHLWFFRPNQMFLRIRNCSLRTDPWGFRKLVTREVGKSWGMKDTIQWHLLTKKQNFLQH